MGPFELVLVIVSSAWMIYGFSVAIPYLEKARKNCPLHSATPYRLRDPADLVATLTVAAAWPLYRKR